MFDDDFQTSDRKPAWQYAVGALATLLLIAISVFFLYLNKTTTLTNVIENPEDTTSLNRGMEIDEPVAGIDYDGDGDGLSDEEERLLGSDPRLFDTDKDGYDDGVEVAAGFNPAGEGALCGETASDAEKWRCFSNQAYASGEDKLCSLISDVGFMEDCYYRVAIKLKDSSLCRRISSPALLVACQSSTVKPGNDLVSVKENDQEKFAPVGKKILRSNIILVLIFQIISSLIGIFLVSAVFHWAAKKVLGPQASYETTLKIIAISGLVYFARSIMAIFSGLYIPVLVKPIAWLGILLLPLMLALEVYLFSRWHGCNWVQNLKIFSLAISIIIVLGIFTWFLMQILFLAMLFYFRGGLGW